MYCRGFVGVLCGRYGAQGFMGRGGREGWVGISDVGLWNNC